MAWFPGVAVALSSVLLLPSALGLIVSDGLVRQSGTTSAGALVPAGEARRVREGTDVESLAAFAHKHASIPEQGDRPLIILTFADITYAPVLMNWMASLRKLRVNNFGVVCLDRDIAEVMTSFGQSCYLRADQNVPSTQVAGMRVGPLKAVWSVRLQILAELLDAGMDVVMSDSDAVWLSSPLADLVQADISATRGQFPDDFMAQYGATLCMGLSYFRGTPAVAKFVREEVLSRFDTDDQLALNRALQEGGLVFGQKLWYQNSTSVAWGRLPVANGSLRVGLLDHAHYPRDCPDASVLRNATVPHCHSPDKQNRAKVERLVTLGLWYLGEDWRRLRPEGVLAEARAAGAGGLEALTARATGLRAHPAMSAPRAPT